MARLSSLMVIFMVLSLSFVHSSHTRLPGDGAATDKARVTQDLDSHVVRSLEKEASALVVEDSAREVPTGPDPLHHNSSPPRPRPLIN